MKEKLKLLFSLLFSLFLTACVQSQVLYPRSSIYYNPYAYSYSGYNLRPQTFRQDIGIYTYGQLCDHVMRFGYKTSINTWQKKEMTYLHLQGRRMNVIAVYHLTIINRSSILRADYYSGSTFVGRSVYEGRFVTTTIYR